MWSLADRMVKAVSDVTVGTVIVLVHVALADRSRGRPRLPPLANSSPARLMSEASGSVSGVQLATAVRRATAADAPALADLVNRAYAVEVVLRRGPADERGRGRADDRARHVPRARVRAAGSPAPCASSIAATSACCRSPPRCGPRAWHPARPHRARRCARRSAAPTIDLKIVNLREELGRWYRSLGYHEVGTAPYTARPVKMPCPLRPDAQELRSVTPRPPRSKLGECIESASARVVLAGVWWWRRVPGCEPEDRRGAARARRSRWPGRSPTWRAAGRLRPHRRGLDDRARP